MQLEERRDSFKEVTSVRPQTTVVEKVMVREMKTVHILWNNRFKRKKTNSYTQFYTVFLNCTQ